MRVKAIFKFIFFSIVFIPAVSSAAFPLATGGRKVLVIWNNDIAYDDYIVEGGSGNNLLDLLTSTGGTWAGNGFNFTVDELKVPSTFNDTATWATAASAVSEAVANGTISSLTAANYCVVFDMRFVNNNATSSGGTQTPGTIAGDTITSGDIQEYQGYLASGAGGLFIMGDNYYTGACGSGSETGFISREENMGTMISAVATTGFTGGSCAIGVGPIIGTGDYEVIPSPGSPYALTTNFNTGLPTEASDYSGPVSIVDLGSGHAWFQHQEDPWAVGIAWDGASGDLQAAYPQARMLYWGDSSMLSLWATGVNDATLPVYIENSVAFLDQDSCCMPPVTPVCGGPNVQLATNPSVVACFQNNADGWTTGTWTSAYDADGSGGGSLQGTSAAYQEQQVVFKDTFTADQLDMYDEICFNMRNASTSPVVFDILSSQYASVTIAGPFTVPAGNVWTHFCETLGGDYATTDAVVFREETSAGSAPLTFGLDSVELQFSCSSHLYVQDPACCSAATPTNTPTITDTPTPSNTPTLTPTLTNTNSPTPTPTLVNTLTNTPTDTVTDTNTVTNTMTNTDSPTLTNTPVPSATNTWTNTITPTDTPTQTPTNTPSPTNTGTPVPSATATNTLTVTLTATTTNTPQDTSTYTPTYTPTSFVGIGKTVSETQANAGDVLSYTIAVTVTGSGIASAVVTDQMPPNMSFVAFGSDQGVVATSESGGELQWQLTSPLTAGVYDLSYELKVNTFAPANVPLTNHAQLTYGGLSNPLTASVPVTVIGNFTVSINIYNSAGEVVKTIPIQSFSTAINNITLSTSNTITTLQGTGSTIDIIYDGDVIGIWNGEDNAGEPVANGSYDVQVDNVSSSGTVTSVSQEAIVNRSVSSVEVDIYNSAGEVVKNLYNVLSNPTTSTMTNVTLSSSVMKPNISSVVNSAAVSELGILVEDSSAPVTLVWNGTNNSGAVVTPGEYEVEVHWTNGNGTTTDITRTVLVLAGTSASGEVLAEPNVLDASYGMTTWFDATSVTNAAGMVVKVYTIDGELIQTISQESTRVSWNASSMASGIYIAHVEVDNAQAGMIDQQLLKILVLH